MERVVDAGESSRKLRLKGMALQELEALVRRLGYDRGEGGAGAMARRVFKWIYHKVRRGGAFWWLGCDWLPHKSNRETV